MIMRFVLPALALACAAPAVAEPATVAVPYGDLDLTKDAGRATLDARLDRAARKVCGGVAPLRDLERMQAWRECLAEARAGYRDQVELALNAANARRVAVLADKLGVFASF
jgi:UrcA family protein